MKGGHWSGLTRNFTYEDFIVEELMGPVVDRTREYLGTSDAVIVRARRMLFDALRDHAGASCRSGSTGLDYRRIRALAIRFPPGTNWLTIDPFDPPGFAAKSELPSSGQPSVLAIHEPGTSGQSISERGG